MPCRKITGSLLENYRKSTEQPLWTPQKIYLDALTARIELARCFGASCFGPSCACLNFEAVQIVMFRARMFSEMCGCEFLAY